MRWRVVVSCKKVAMTFRKWSLQIRVSTTCWRLIHLEINSRSSPADLHYKDCCSQLQSKLECTSAHLAFMFCLRKVFVKSLRALFSPSPVCPLPPPPRPLHHLPVLSLEVWELWRSSTSSTFLDNECFPCHLSYPRILCSTQKATDSSRQPAHPPSFFIFCFHLCRRTSSHRLCSQRAEKRIKVRRSHLIGEKSSDWLKASRCVSVSDVFFSHMYHSLAFHPKATNVP